MHRMLTCDDALPLIARSVDGIIDRVAGERLTQHLKQCRACQIEAASQALVKQVLAERPDETLPAGFAARVSARLDAEKQTGWLDLANWRSWSIGALSAAVVLLLLAALVGHARRVELADAQLNESLVRALSQGSLADVLITSTMSGDATVDELLLSGLTAAGAGSPQ